MNEQQIILEVYFNNNIYKTTVNITYKIEKLLKDVCDYFNIDKSHFSLWCNNKLVENNEIKDYLQKEELKVVFILKKIIKESEQTEQTKALTSMLNNPLFKSNWDYKNFIKTMTETEELQNLFKKNPAVYDALNSEMFRDELDKLMENPEYL